MKSGSLADHSSTAWNLLGGSEEGYLWQVQSKVAEIHYELIN